MEAWEVGQLIYVGRLGEFLVLSSWLSQIKTEIVIEFEFRCVP